MWMNAGIAPRKSSSVHLDRCLGCAKRRPFEQGQAQVDGRGIERIDRRIEIEVQRLGGVERSGTGDQPYCQRMIDTPVAQVQRVRQGGACRHVLQSHMKQLAPIRSEAGLDVAQGFAPRQLREGHHAKQIGATKRSHTCVAAVSIDDAAKRLPRHKLHDLRKQRLAHVHALPRVVQTRKIANADFEIQIVDTLEILEPRVSSRSPACRPQINRTLPLLDVVDPACQARWYLQTYFFRCGGRSVQMPSNNSAAMPTDSPSVG